MGNMWLSYLVSLQALFKPSKRGWRAEMITAQQHLENHIFPYPALLKQKHLFIIEGSHLDTAFLCRRIGGEGVFKHFISEKVC